MDERNLGWTTRRKRWSCGAHSAWNSHWTISAKAGRKPPSSARSCGKDQESCSGSSVVSGRAFESAACICAKRAFEKLPPDLRKKIKTTPLHKRKRFVKNLRRLATGARSLMRTERKQNRRELPCRNAVGKPVSSSRSRCARKT